MSTGQLGDAKGKTYLILFSHIAPINSIIILLKIKETLNNSVSGKDNTLVETLGLLSALYINITHVWSKAVHFCYLKDWDWNTYSATHVMSCKRVCLVSKLGNLLTFY